MTRAAAASAEALRDVSEAERLARAHRLIAIALRLIDGVLIEAGDEFDDDDLVVARLHLVAAYAASLTHH